MYLFHIHCRHKVILLNYIADFLSMPFLNIAAFSTCFQTHTHTLFLRHFQVLLLQSSFKKEACLIFHFHTDTLTWKISLWISTEFQTIQASTECHTIHFQIFLICFSFMRFSHTFHCVFPFTPLDSFNPQNNFITFFHHHTNNSTKAFRHNFHTMKTHEFTEFSNEIVCFICFISLLVRCRKNNCEQQQRN